MKWSIAKLRKISLVRLPLSCTWTLRAQDRCQNGRDMKGQHAPRTHNAHDAYYRADVKSRIVLLRTDLSDVRTGKPGEPIDR
jgi:hypothetical protein